jgi:hypothetical protein
MKNVMDNRLEISFVMLILPIHTLTADGAMPDLHEPS